MVIAANDIAECREPLLDTLDLDFVRDTVAQVLELLVGGAGRDEKTFAVSGGQTTDNAGASDGCVADGYYVLQFSFEDGVEVLRCADGNESVAVGESREDTDSGKKQPC